MTDLMHASNQWAKRPADETFKSLAELHQRATLYRDSSREDIDRDFSTLRIGATPEGDVALKSEKGGVARLSNWAFGQLCTKMQAPASYLRTLPAPVVANLLEYGKTKKLADGELSKTNLLLHSNGGQTVRAMTSNKYERIWNAEVSGRIIDLTLAHPEWQPAPESYAREDGSTSVGLYLSWHDNFMFMVDNERRIFEKDPNGGLSRGFFVWNSEVGAKSFGITTFLYNYVCGNHIVWGAKDVKTMKVRHVGDARQRMEVTLTQDLKGYSEASAYDDEARIIRAKTLVLGMKKEDVLDAVFKLAIPNLSKQVVTQAYDLAVKREDWYGEPNTVWGMANGITEIARDIEFADERVELDTAAGKLLDVTADWQ